MNAWYAIPFPAAIPDGAILYPPLVSSDALTVAALTLAVIASAVAWCYRRAVMSGAAGRRPIILRPAH